MIKMSKLVQLPAGVNSNMFKEMIRQTEESLGFEPSVQVEQLTRRGLQSMIKEEYTRILDEAKEQAPKIHKKLEDMRLEMFNEYFKRDNAGGSYLPVLEKRIQINTVAEMLDMKINELVLYFLNEVKTDNDRPLVTYSLGHVYFRAN